MKDLFMISFISIVGIAIQTYIVQYYNKGVSDEELVDKLQLVTVI